MKASLQKSKKKIWISVILCAAVLLILAYALTPSIKFQEDNSYIFNGKRYTFVQRDTDEYDRLNRSIMPYTKTKTTVVKAFPFFKIQRTMFNDNIIVKDSGLFGDDFYISEDFSLPKADIDNIELIYINYKDSDKIEQLCDKGAIQALFQSFKDNNKSDYSEIAYLKVKYYNFDEYEALFTKDLN